MKIVSLLPSATEMLCALGLGDELVAVTHGCDFPPGVMGLPRITSCSIPKEAPSGEVDRLVRERHAAGLPLYELDRDLLARLAPDLLVTQGLCDVCALPDGVVRQAACDLAIVPRVVSLGPTRLSEVFDNIQELGRVTGRAALATDLLVSLQGRVDRVAARTARLRDRPRVTLLEWVDPLYACGHWTPELVTLAGGREGHATAGARSRTLAWAEVMEWQPEVLVVAACGLDTAQGASELASLASRPGFAALPCAAHGRVFAVDGSAFFSRPGPRLVESLELLAHLLHPALFPDSPAPFHRVSRSGHEAAATPV